MLYAIVYSTTMRRLVIHQTEDNMSTLCGRDIMEEFVLQEEAWQGEGAIVCQACQRKLEPVKEPEKVRTGMYMGHRLSRN